MPETPQLAPLDVKEQRLYSELLLDGRAPHPTKSVPAGTPPVLDDHAYSKPEADGSKSDTDSASSPACGNPSPRPVERLSAEEQSELLRKERQRTLRLKQKLASLKKSMEKAAEESKSIQGIIRNAKRFLREPALSFFAWHLQDGTGKDLAVCDTCLSRMQALKDKAAP